MKLKTIEQKLEVFRPEDFPEILNWDNPPGIGIKWARETADIANSRLEAWLKENGRVYYGNHSKSTFHIKKAKQIKYVFKALLINIEPIEKCTHPAKKVRPMKTDYERKNWPVFYGSDFLCECGARVKPIAFKEVKK